MAGEWDDWRDIASDLLWPVVVFFLVALVLVAVLATLSGCQTVEAVAAAPEEFWITLEEILLALWGDVMTVVDWVL